MSQSNYNYEEGLLSDLLSHNCSELSKVSWKLKPDMFQDEIYRSIYGAMLEGHTDASSIINKLKDAYVDIEIIVKNLVTTLDYLGIDINKYAQEIINIYCAKQINELIENTEINQYTVGNLRKTLRQIDELIPYEEEETTGFNDLKVYAGNYFKPKPPGFNLGIETIDNLLKGVDKGDVLVIAARPSVGKSALALQILGNNKHLKGCYFNLEMGEQQIYERLIASESGINLGHLRMAEHFNNNEEEEFRKANEKLDEYSNIKIKTESQSIAKIRNEVRKGKYDFIVVDYLQLVEPDIARGSNRAAEVSDISRGLKAIARDFECVVVALSQLNRRSEGTEDKEPTMSDLRESGAIEQDAASIIIMWRHKDDYRRNIKVEKARNGVRGRTELFFDGAHMKFDESGSIMPKAPQRLDGVLKDFKPAQDSDDIPFT